MLNRTRRATALIGSVVVATLLVAGCSSSSDSPASGASAQRITVDWATGNTTLDPAAACNQDDLSLIHNTYATLTQYGTEAGPKGTTQYDPTKIVPSFATKWSVSPDGKTYTFTLPSGAKFSDGSPMDSSAVKFSVERVLGSGTCAGFYLQGGLYQQFAGVSPESVDVTVEFVDDATGEVLTAGSYQEWRKNVEQQQ